MDKDLYEILGVKKDATEAEIRKAFLKLAKKHHPDVNPGNKEAEQRFKEVNLAHEVLKDAKKRAQYDQMRAAGANPFASRGAGGARPGPGYGAESFGDFGLGDLFQEIFGSGFAGGMGGGGFGGAREGRRAGPFPQRGADREMSLSISFQEAARGGERVIEFNDGRRLTVKIPEGVDNGSKIKLAQQGAAGMAGGPNGDLYIILDVQAHPLFVREGSDILLKLPLTFSEAVLGGEVEVPTLDGKVVLKVPKGISSGQRLKLAGKGIGMARRAQRGDQFVEVLIKVPKSPDTAYQEAAERLQADGFNPRSGLF